MSDTDQEHAEHDPGLEIVDLGPSNQQIQLNSKQELYNALRGKLQPWQLLRERRKTRLAITSIAAIVGLVILLSVSGVFSMLLAKITYALPLQFALLGRSFLLSSLLYLPVKKMDLPVL